MQDCSRTFGVVGVGQAPRRYEEYVRQGLSLVTEIFETSADTIPLHRGNRAGCSPKCQVSSASARSHLLDEHGSTASRGIPSQWSKCRWQLATSVIWSTSYPMQGSVRAIPIPVSDEGMTKYFKSPPWTAVSGLS